MKIRCEECGTTIQTGDNDQARIESLLEDHQKTEHGTLEARQTIVLTKCLTHLQVLLAGVTIPAKDTRSLANEVSALLKIPIPIAASAVVHPAPTHVAEPGPKILDLTKR